MVAHGADFSNVDEETFRDICVMYSDGVIGNNSLLQTLGSLTGAVYNYMRSPNSPSYQLDDIISRVYDYLYPPQDKKEAVNAALLGYVSRAKGFDKNRFKGGKWQS
jgi:hypothetical protein